MRGSLDLLREARGWWDVVSGTIVPPLLEGEAAFLAEAGAALPAEPWDGGTFAAWVGALRDVTGRKGRALMVPLRLALTGEEQGPDLGELLPLMGRARVAERLRLAAGRSGSTRSAGQPGGQRGGPAARWLRRPA